jgi:hypothetical protein
MQLVVCAWLARRYANRPTMVAEAVPALPAVAETTQEIAA